LCLMQSEIDCKECPFVTCNNHPQFYLALQCAMWKSRGGVGAAGESS
jgi:hypothetical protein